MNLNDFSSEIKHTILKNKVPIELTTIEEITYNGTTIPKGTNLTVITRRENWQDPHSKFKLDFKYEDEIISLPLEMLVKCNELSENMDDYYIKKYEKARKVLAHFYDPYVGYYLIPESEILTTDIVDAMWLIINHSGAYGVYFNEEENVCNLYPADYMLDVEFRDVEAMKPFLFKELKKGGYKPFTTLGKQFYSGKRVPLIDEILQKSSLFENQANDWCLLLTTTNNGSTLKFIEAYQLGY